MTTTTIEPATRSRGRAHRYKEAAKILNISDRSVIRLIRTGKIKVTYLGPRSPRIFDDAIDAYLAAQESE
jgi:excisionase family DNA binding protein